MRCQVERTVGRAGVAIAAIVLTLPGCRLSALPPHAFRLEPPAGIELRALPVGAAAPDFTLASSAGAPWTLRDQLARGPAVLVFYRGHW